MTEHMDRDPLTEQLGRLPTEMQPERDLWPGIEAGLERRPAELDGEQEPAREPRRWGAREWGLQSLAALLFMALGSLITWLSTGVSTGGPDPRVATHDSTVAGVVSSTGSQSNIGSQGNLGSQGNIGSQGNLGSQSTGSYETVSFGGQKGHPLDVVEANYLRARDALWLQAVENREALPPGTLKVVEKNLEILERAISDLRKALALDPGNPNLERRLLDNHQRSIDMLRRVVREV